LVSSSKNQQNMLTFGQFYKRLTFWTIYERVRLAQTSYVPVVLIMFMVAYILDSFLGYSYNLSQLTIAGWTGLVGLAWLFLMELRDVSINRWNLFPLLLDEIILARKNDNYVLARTSQDLRNGALRGCRELYLVAIKPWRRRPIGFAVGDISINLSVSLELQKIDTPGVYQWLNYAETDVINIIHRASADTIARIGEQSIQESSYLLKKLVEDEVNSKYLGATGMTMSIGAVRLYRIKNTATQA
jgi:hypothetical protein